MDFHTLVCFPVPGTPQEIELLLSIHTACEHLIAQEPPQNTPVKELARGIVFDTHGELFLASVGAPTFEKTDDGIIITDDEHAEIGYLATLLSVWMLEIKRPGCLTFQYALTASQSTPDSYGGGGVLVWAGGWDDLDSTDIDRPWRFARPDEIGRLHFYDFSFSGPGLHWLLTDTGWQAFSVADVHDTAPIYSTGRFTIPTCDDGIAAAAQYKPQEAL